MPWDLTLLPELRRHVLSQSHRGTLRQHARDAASSKTIERVIVAAKQGAFFRLLNLFSAPIDEDLLSGAFNPAA